MDTTKRASWWGLTLNNPTSQDRQTISGQPPRWLKMVKGQDEIGENGTLHVQMVINTEQVRMSSIKEWLPRAHIEAAKSAKHKDNLLEYVHKEETAVAGSRFEHKYREDSVVQTMAQTLTMVAELAWTDSQIKDAIDNAQGKKKIDDVYADEFWEAVNVILADRPDMVAIFTIPNYLLAWKKTRGVWIKRLEVDRQTALSLAEAYAKENPGL